MTFLNYENLKITKNGFCYVVAVYLTSLHYDPQPNTNTMKGVEICVEVCKDVKRF